MRTNMKLKIQEKATELFKEYGYNNVSIVKICEACNISKTTFYFHYKSKHDLIINYFYKANQDAESILKSAIMYQNTIDQIWSIIVPYFESTLEAGVSIARELFREYLYDTDSPLIPNNIYMKQILIDLIKKGISNKEIKTNIPAEDLFVSMMNLSNGYTLQWIMQDGNFDLIAETKKGFFALFHK